MSNQHPILVLYLLMCCVRVLSNNSKDPTDDQCSLQCTTPKLRRGEVYSKCNISDLMKLQNCSSEESSRQLRNVSFLDLSHNNLNQVPSWMFSFFKNLTIISLAQNNIKTIKPGTFKDLRNLGALNLSFNGLCKWEVNGNELSSLNKLDVTGNEHWLPGGQFVQLNNLMTVEGVTWTKYCKNCSLVKIKPTAPVDNSTFVWGSRDRFTSPSRWLWNNQLQYGKALCFIKAGFWPTCLSDHVCYVHQYEIRYYQATVDVIMNVSFSLYATGSVALLVNITVVLFISFNKSLRRDLAVCLVLNVALCDALIGLFSLLFVIYNPSKMYIENKYDILEDNNNDGLSKIENVRNIMGPILTCAVASQVFGSFILTLEKFFKIVYAMNPNVRIGKRSTLLFLFLSWSISVTFAVLPVFKVGRMTYNEFRDTTPFPADQATTVGVLKVPVGIAAAFQITLIIIQLTSFVLYLPIFIAAKRSGANVGIKREATIARKIMFLVFTNLIFFTVPAMIGIFQLKLWLTFGLEMRNNWKDHEFAEYQWTVFAFTNLPGVCVSINSVLNPFIYAFRHPKIKQQLHTFLSRCRAVLSECFVYLTQHLHCHSNEVLHGNDIREMQNPNI